MDTRAISSPTDRWIEAQFIERGRGPHDGDAGDARASCPCAACHLLRGLLSRRRPTRAYALLMRTLYMTTAGTSDPTRASISLHLAVNGSLEVGHDVGVVLAGDATELLKTAVRESLEGVGVPPVRDLLAKAHQHNLPIYV